MIIHKHVHGVSATVSFVSSLIPQCLSQFCQSLVIVVCCNLYCNERYYYFE